jgi:hypothetical protein
MRQAKRVPKCQKPTFSVHPDGVALDGEFALSQMILVV